MTILRKFRTAAVAGAGAVAALAGLALSPIAHASTPSPGIGVIANPVLIGDLPWTTGFYPPPYGEFGNDPVTPGGSWTGSATFINTGSEAETVSCAQHNPATGNGPESLAPVIPASWMSVALSGDPSGVLQPGQSLSAAITVNVPADAAVLPYSPPVMAWSASYGVYVVSVPPATGYYSGMYICTASALNPVTGVTNVSTGAGLGEYLRVVAPTS